MSNDKHPMTVDGKKQLEMNLKQFLQVERPNVIQAIEEARANGDLSENADYDAAKERQGFVEHVIKDIQSKLALAEVINPKEINVDHIVFGATVTLLDCETDVEVTYALVGEDEADVELGKLSIFSPLARAIIGKKEGAMIDFKSPKGEKEYEVIKIKYI